MIENQKFWFVVRGGVWSSNSHYVASKSYDNYFEAKQFAEELSKNAMERVYVVESVTWVEAKEIPTPKPYSIQSGDMVKKDKDNENVV